VNKLSTQSGQLGTTADRVLNTLFGRYIEATRLRRLLVLHREWVLVGALTLLGLALRRYHLGVESFWFDEADIVAQAQAPAGQILTDFTKAGANGPLYTLLLHFWIMLVGTSEAAVRTLPLIFGTATIPLMYLAGRRLLTPALGLLGALLLTISPFHIWHSQDAKMYTLVVFIILLSTGLYLLALERDRPLWWLAYLLATWVALYAHILSGLVLVAQLLVTPLLLRRIRAVSPTPETAPQRRAQRNRLLLAWGILLLPFLPIALDRVLALGAGKIVAGWLTPISLGDMLGVLFVRFAVNRADAPWEALGAWWMGALFVLGLWPLLGLLRRRAGGQAAPRGATTWAALLILWVVPIALFWVATLRVPLFEARYMIIVLPFYLFFVAGGLLRLRSWHPALLLVGLLGIAAPTVAALGGVNYGPYGQKENWREAVDFVRQHERLRDVVIVYPGYLVTAVNYYRNAQDLATVPVLTIPQLETQHFGEREFNDVLMAAVTDHERAWLVISPPRADKEDPQRRVLQWFQYNWHQFEKRVYNGVEIYGFAFNGQPRSWFPEPDHPQELHFANGLIFRGYIYELRNNAPAVQNAGWLPLTLYWETRRPLPVEYAFRIELLDAQGQVKVRDGPLPPLNGYWPTTQWLPTGPIIDYRDVFLPGDLPPGAYTVRLTVVPRDQPDQPLSLADGSTSFVLDTPLTVVPWQAPAAK
jgi:hypothetical protein